MDIEEIREITFSIKTSASNIYNLLENLLEWSRLRRGGLDFVPVTFNLKNKILSSIDVLQETAKQKNIELNLLVPPDIEVFADNHMFDALIRNLTSNALKFTVSGGKVTISASELPDKSVEVRVSDSGIGMTPELRNKLFRITEKTSRPGTSGETSTGLGLLLCKEFIDRHNGKIGVETEVGKGSTFSFNLPAIFHK